MLNLMMARCIGEQEECHLDEGPESVMPVSHEPGLGGMYETEDDTLSRHETRCRSTRHVVRERHLPEEPLALCRAQ